MLTTRSIYNGDLEYYRRSDRGLPLTLGQTSPPSEHGLSSHSSRRQSPMTEADQKSTGSQRKRVPVACERCRKRKIKCSGDEGGGQGCVNCRNAGWDGCQFLRVQSFNAPVNTAAVASGRAWISNGRYHPYSHFGHRPTSQSQQAYHTGLPSYPMWTGSVDYGTYPSSTQPAAWTRPSYSPQYSLPYENEPGDSYSSTPPSYMLPDPAPALHLNMSHTNMSSRPQQQAVWLDQVTTVPMIQPSGHVSSTYGMGLPEGHSAYTTMHPSVNSRSPSERLLSSSSVVRSLPSVSMTVSDTPPLSAASNRSSVGWQAETASNASVTSSHTSQSGRQEAGNSFGNIPYAQQGLSFGYGNTSAATHDLMTTPILPVSTDELRGKYSVREIYSPPVTRKRYRVSSREVTHSSSPNAQSHNYGYDGTNLHERRETSNTGSVSTAMDGSCGWPPCKDLLKDANYESCSHDGVESQQHS